MVLVLHTFIDNAEFSYRTIKGYPAFSYSATSFCLVSTFLLGIYIYIYIYRIKIYKIYNTGLDIITDISTGISPAMLPTSAVNGSRLWLTQFNKQ